MAVRQTDKSQEIHKLNPALSSCCCENTQVGVSEVPRVSAECALPGFCQTVSKYHHPDLNTRFARFEHSHAHREEGKAHAPSPCGSPGFREGWRMATVPALAPRDGEHIPVVTHHLLGWTPSSTHTKGCPLHGKWSHLFSLSLWKKNQVLYCRHAKIPLIFTSQAS